MRSAVRICPAAPKSIENFGFRCFLVAKMLKNVWVKMWVNCLTHTVTHKRKCTERMKEYRRGSFCFLSGIFASFFCSHHLRHEAAHFLRGLLLHLPSGVGVGAECEARIIVTQYTADGFDVHPVLECQGRERMPLRYNYDKPEKPRTSRVFGYLARFFILFQTEKSSREVVIS